MAATSLVVVGVGEEESRSLAKAIDLSLNGSNHSISNQQWIASLSAGRPGNDVHLDRPHNIFPCGLSSHGICPRERPLIPGHTQLETFPLLHSSFRRLHAHPSRTAPRRHGGGRQCRLPARQRRACWHRHDRGLAGQHGKARQSRTGSRKTASCGSNSSAEAGNHQPRDNGSSSASTQEKVTTALRCCATADDGGAASSHQVSDPDDGG